MCFTRRRKLNKIRKMRALRDNMLDDKLISTEHIAKYPHVEYVDLLWGGFPNASFVIEAMLKDGRKIQTSHPRSIKMAMYIMVDAAYRRWLEEYLNPYGFFEITLYGKEKEEEERKEQR